MVMAKNVKYSKAVRRFEVSAMSLVAVSWAYIFIYLFDGTQATPLWLVWVLAFVLSVVWLFKARREMKKCLD